MWKIIAILFLGALAIRLLYFPDDIYFAYDQARDSYTSLEILKGDFKIVGPPSAASDKLFPGPLIFYVYAPIYFLFDKNPEAIAVFLRIFNSLGVFLTFLIASNIFNKKVGLISALFFALSYEASQYSLFISHQALAVIPVLLFYLGLSMLVFKKNKHGLLLAALGAGLSIQFHYIYILLLPILLITILLKGMKIALSFSSLLLSLLIFIATISTYIISEIKFDFRVTSTLLNSNNSGFHLNETMFVINRFFHDNFLGNYRLVPIIIILFAATSIYFLFQKKLRMRISFLLIWFLGGLIPYFLSGTPSYYYSAGAAASLFIFSAFLIDYFWGRKKIITLSLFFLIIFNNLNLIFTSNKFGPNKDFIIQPGMLMADEKRVLDYIYKSADNEQFAAGALTVPLNINTTWSYLFEWYGKQKYHRLPNWVGPIAEGYKGLKGEGNRSKLPKTQFLIIEPTTGIRQGIIDNFFKVENYFTKIVEEKQFGTLRVQKRERI